MGWGNESSCVSIAGTWPSLDSAGSNHSLSIVALECCRRSFPSGGRCVALSRYCETTRPLEIGKSLCHSSAFEEIRRAIDAKDAGKEMVRERDKLRNCGENHSAFFLRSVEMAGKRSPVVLVDAGVAARSDVGWCGC